MGSNEYARALKTLYRRHRDIANRRRDWFWKLSHELCSRYGVIAIEDLDIKGMVRLWGRKVHDYAFSEFMEIRKKVLPCKRCKSGTYYANNPTLLVKNRKKSIITLQKPKPMM